MFVVFLLATSSFFKVLDINLNPGWDSLTKVGLIRSADFLCATIGFPIAPFPIALSLHSSLLFILFCKDLRIQHIRTVYESGYVWPTIHLWVYNTSLFISIERISLKGMIYSTYMHGIDSDNHWIVNPVSGHFQQVVLNRILFDGLSCSSLATVRSQEEFRITKKKHTALMKRTRFCIHYVNKTQEIHILARFWAKKETTRLDPSRLKTFGVFRGIASYESTTAAHFKYFWIWEFSGRGGQEPSTRCKAACRQRK